MNRWIALAFGVACYLFTGAVAIYTVGFLIDWGVPNSAGRGGGLSLESILIDSSLIALFGLQHSVMARSSFKHWWTRFIPEPIERSTYVLFSDLAFVVLFACWQPLPGDAWHVANPVLQALLWALALLGVMMMTAATFAIDHCDLFGLRQVWDYFRGRTSPDVPFQIPVLYRFSRHPLMLGLLLALWSTPQMTWGRLLFVAGMSVYIFIGVQFEERDLRRRFGEDYERYRRRVPMFLGMPRRIAA
jgi:protein-S-isoprenylcysteine O-methyltransferase Ste14